MTTNNGTPKIMTGKELVKFTVSHKHYKDTRWELSDRTGMEYDDPVAGAEWEKLYSAHQKGYIPGYYRLLGDKDPKALAYEAEEKRIEGLRPKMHPEVHWTLREVDVHSYRGDNIDLSGALGRAIDKIWTKKHPRWNPNREERTGRLTLMGILKRLGQDIESIKYQIVEAEKAEEVAIATRNYKYEIKKLEKAGLELAELLDSIQNSANAAGIEGLSLTVKSTLFDINRAASKFNQEHEDETA